MIEKVLNKYGFYKVDNEKLLDLYISNLPDLEGEMTIEDEERLMKELNNVDNFKKWLQVVIFRDMKNHYIAINDKQRDTIRGASQRLLDITKKMLVSEKPKTTNTKITGIRYGS